ncbi:septation protein SepH [Planctomonas psychrotolerans]|uniref:septation protein SepH n=1 Tax=Planctomonas psychrotolerans TaxID=2528712 RepID=UPI00123AD728|nr:septation protein SepH [Planctomonas psychrotolerans]
MQDLKVIGVENGALLASSEQGGRYRIPIDEVLQSRLRPHTPEQHSGRKVPPREIQAQIRSGMSAAEVAAATGLPIEHVQRYEGPVLAEREHIVTSALSVTVHTAIDVDPLSPGTRFGDVISERLVALGAEGEQWTSWKDEDHWVVRLEFTAEQIDHDARWSYDPKKRALAPQNNEAITLSQQGEIKGALIPRLRAVPSEGQSAPESRFDSGAFRITDVGAPEEAPESDSGARADGRTSGTVSGIARAAEAKPQLNQTADLLDALRRRRGEREAAAWGDERPAPAESVPNGNGIRVIDVPLGDFAEESADAGDPTPSTASPVPSFGRSSGAKSAKRGRTAMPSWDEIVFGARSDEDPA